MKIVEQIADKLCAVDKSGSRDYLVNCEMYKTKLLELDIRFRTTVLQAERNTLVFADRFPMRYFTLEYGLNYYAAFPGCASESNPRPNRETICFLHVYSRLHFRAAA